MPLGLLGVEVTRIRVVDDDRVGGLLGYELELLAQVNSDAFGVQQVDDLRAVFELWTRRVAERVAAAAIFGTQQAVQVARIAVRERRAGGQDEFSAYPPVPVFGQRLGQLYGQPVHLEVVAV